MTERPIVLAGGTGFLGMNLANALVAQDRKVVILSRSRPADGQWTWAQWDGKSQGDWSKHIDGAQAIVNFSGKSIDCYPNDENRKLIISSRVDPIHALGEAIQSAAEQPSTWIQLSAVGIYGNTINQCTESSPAGEGFLPEVCSQWESAFNESCPDSMRGVSLRAGVVLGKNDGAFPLLRKLAKFGFGGAAGNGKQGMSWIHEDDMTSILLQAIDSDSMQGTYNVCAPNPLSNRDFMRTLRKVVGMPFGPPAPAFAVRLGARFVLKTNPDLVLEGQYAIPERLKQQNFAFKFGNPQEAFLDLCSR
jgi:uncharacterized protein